MAIFSVSNKLILILIIAMVVVFSIRAPINHQLSKKDYEVQLKHKSELLEKRLILAISSPIWNLHYDLVKEIIKIESEDLYIASISVKDIDGNEIANVSNMDIPNKKTFLSSFAVKFMDEHIANVEILFDQEFINDKLVQNFFTSFIQFLITLVFVVVVFKIAIDVFVIKNLKRLKRSITNIRNNKIYNKHIELDTQDEFSVLAKEFNAMQDAIDNTLKNLEKLNAELEERIKIEVEKNSKKEKELYDKAKFIQMGEMISNIAHHWRQPLSAISTTASGIKLQKEFGALSDNELLESIDSIMIQTQKLSATIDDFRKFFIEDHTHQKVEFDLKNMFEKLHIILTPTLEEKMILLDIQCEDKILVYGYQNELFQVILNLISNSIEAFEQKSSQENNRFIKICSFNNDNKIFIEVEDNAGGIPTSYIDKIFNPYFTTKHQKQGVGVSLYMSKEIIFKHHNGDISVSNTQNGAKFTITIPII